MDVQTPFISNNSQNRNPNQQEIKPTPYYENNYPINQNVTYNPSPIQTGNSNLNITPSPLSINTSSDPYQNPKPVEVLQYPNSSDFPQFNKISNTSNQVQIDYSKYTNINQLNHKGIRQKNQNTFYVTEKCCCNKTFPIVFFLLSVSYSSACIFSGINIKTIIGFCFGTLLIMGGVLMLCKSYHTVYFKLEDNCLKIREVAWCGWKTTFYYPGQLTQIEFTSENELDLKGRQIYIYKIRIYHNMLDQISPLIYYHNYHKKRLFTDEEIGYFNYIMNKYIQTKMRN